jgi:glycosyltransferase involved in cell wall biosynthesis
VKDLSIIVPAYNEELELPRTLERINDIRKHLPVTSELIVVDNNSSDATAQVAERWGARVVFEAVNQISRARNAGAREATGKTVLFIDADTRPPPELVEAVVFSLNDTAIIGGGTTLVFEGEITASARMLTSAWNLFAQRVGLAAGCFIWCEREAFLAVGGFPETQYAGEEVTFVRALKRYARKQSRRFQILSKHPVKTSARKLAWYGTFYSAGLVVLLGCFPFLMRSRTVCRFWYRRPPG